MPKLFFSARPAGRWILMPVLALTSLALVSGSGAGTFAEAAASAPAALTPRAYLPFIINQPIPRIWISSSELAALPTSGPAWNQLKQRADQSAGTPDLGDQNSETNVTILAKALVFARTGQTKYRDDVVTALRVITFNNTEKMSERLALSRQLVGYVIAADLIALPGYDPTLHAQFSHKLRELLTKNLDPDPGEVATLQTTHENRANNWGTHAGASRAAVAVYLEDRSELARTAQVFKGWLGDRNAYAGFSFGELWWQADPANPVAVNPLGAMKDGHSIDGALPEELRRCGTGFQWPPCQTDYAWDALQGALVQAEILSRAGYPVWGWENQALLRAAQFLYGIGWPAANDDEWQPWILNHAYGAAFPITTPAQPGKNMGWTDWTHSASRP